MVQPSCAKALALVSQNREIRFVLARKNPGCSEELCSMNVGVDMIQFTAL
jgi:hypothetical protein